MNVELAQRAEKAQQQLQTELTFWSKVQDASQHLSNAEILLALPSFGSTVDCVSQHLEVRAIIARQELATKI